MAVGQAPWNYVDEKVAGIVAQIATYTEQYDRCLPHLKEIIIVLQQIYETMRQCCDQQLITLHVTNVNYSAKLKKTLLIELKSEMAARLWKLSAELLEMQLDVSEQLVKREAKTFADIARIQLMGHLTGGPTKAKKGGGGLMASVWRMLTS